MDIRMFKDEERFSTNRNLLADDLDLSSSSDEGENYSSNDIYNWEIDNEKENNGDIALIPEASNISDTVNMNIINLSPPFTDEFQKIMSDWQYMDLEHVSAEFPMLDPIPLEDIDITIKQENKNLPDIFNTFSCGNTLDIHYINEEPKLTQKIPVRKVRAGVKKIDIKAQKYIVDNENDVDIEVSESSESESSESEFDSESKIISKGTPSDDIKSESTKTTVMEPANIESIFECEEPVIETAAENIDISELETFLEAPDIDSLLEQFEAKEMTEISPNLLEESVELSLNDEFFAKQEPNSLNTKRKSSDKSIKCVPKVTEVKKESIEKGVMKIKSEPPVEININKIQPKTDIRSIKQEKTETQLKPCNAKEEYKRKPVKTKDHVHLVKKLDKTPNSIEINQEKRIIKKEEFVTRCPIGASTKPFRKDKISNSVDKVVTLKEKRKVNPPKSEGRSISATQVSTGAITLKPPISDNFKTKNSTKSDVTGNPPVKNKHNTKNLKGNATPSRPVIRTPVDVQHIIPPEKSESTTSFPQDSTKHSTTNNKQIRDALPQDLIDRIKESGKRKTTISVISPLPGKKRGASWTQDAETQIDPKKRKLSCFETIQLDHDYCNSEKSPKDSSSENNIYPKLPYSSKKDSGFESAEEDDRAIIRKQPMVKNADGKLMVSLLKVNTIRNTESLQKKRLNLEEYKKRKAIILTPQNNSRNSSPMSSTCSSPLPEDENTKRLKEKLYEETIKKMCISVLNTPPKSESKPIPTLPVIPPPPTQVPSDMEKKTVVSIGVNTDFKICKSMNPVTPVEQLEEIKPLLKQASTKINCNSLITSLIENIPKVMNKSDPVDLKTTEQASKFEHGEDKTIVFLPKNREAIKTASVEVQTNISLIQKNKQQSRYRRRNLSVSSNSSSSSGCSRHSTTSASYHRFYRMSENSSGSSRSSRTCHSSYAGSSYSSSSSSSSRSRSTSPKYSHKERERLREVEERRVIYVGRISSKSTKEDLRKRFLRFGPITNISLHFRDHGDNYGFVTFANKLDAYKAIEHGNDDPYEPKYDLSFGGRRIFCKTTYSDLDNMRDENSYFPPRTVEDSFDTLLREAQEKLRKRKV